MTALQNLHSWINWNVVNSTLKRSVVDESKFIRLLWTCSRFGLSPFWLVAGLTCRHFESGSEAHIQVKEIKHRETQTHTETTETWIPVTTEYDSTCKKMVVLSVGIGQVATWSTFHLYIYNGELTILRRVRVGSMVSIRWSWISMHNICCHCHFSKICQWRFDRVMSWLCSVPVMWVAVNSDRTLCIALHILPLEMQVDRRCQPTARVLSWWPYG